MSKDGKAAINKKILKQRLYKNLSRTLKEIAASFFRSKQNNNEIIHKIA